MINETKSAKEATLEKSFKDVDSNGSVAAGDNTDKKDSISRSYSEDTARTTVTEDDVSSGEASTGDQEESEDDMDVDARISSKSLASHSSSKVSTSVKQLSSLSVMSQQSQSSSSSSRAGNGPTVEDMALIRERLRTSLEEEKKLLTLQQELLVQLEEIDHSIIKAQTQERIARVTSQQTHVMGLLGTTLQM